jgi:Polyketide cyclase / dehydrase and lipid transport
MPLSRLLRPGRLSLIVLALVTLATSVYAQTDFHITDSVVIRATPAQVFDFMSDSGQARGWSIFFDHISPLPGPSDGGLGAKRRCFRRADETGPRWDEEVTEITPNRSRRIHVYGAAGFRAGIYVGTEEEIAHRYEEIAPGVTKLTFDARVIKGSPLDRLALFCSELETHRIFRDNLANIRDMIEQGDKYERRYAWESYSPADL